MNPNNPKKFLQCGGALLDELHVVTAAHCLVDRTVQETYRVKDVLAARIYLGVYSIRSTDLPPPMFAKEFVLPRDYLVDKPGNDLALIVLERPVIFDGRIAPICLPQTGDKSYAGKMFRTAGWGLVDNHRNVTSIPKEVDLRHIPDSTCYKMKQNYYVTTGLAKRKQISRVPNIAHGEICALGEQKQDSCFGDSGNPLMWKDPANGHWFLVGVTSGALDTCNSKTLTVPGMYTEADKFIPTLISQHVLQARFLPYGRLE